MAGRHSAEPPRRVAPGRSASSRRRVRPWVMALGITAGTALVVGAVVALANPFGPSGDAWVPPGTEQPQSTEESPQSEHIFSPPVEQPTEPVTFTIVGGGDVLIHMPVAASAWNGQIHDFSALMEPVAPYLRGSDLAICNMETPVVGPGEAPSGFPLFGAPYAIVEELQEAGWKGCSNATNHALDQGLHGINTTLGRMDEVGMGHVGTARSQEEADSPQIYVIEKDGEILTVAHFSVAHDTNGLPIPEEAPWSVNMLDVEHTIQQARAAREAGADLVIVSVHCCSVEYTTDPEPLQVEIAEELAASGQVDIYLGHHAHVPKTIDLLSGGPTGDGMWVAYGLGNFISNQGTHCCREETSTGVLAFFEVQVADGEIVAIPEASWLAVTVDWVNGHSLRPLFADGAEGSALPPEELQRRHAQIIDLMGDTPAVERTSPPDHGIGTTTPLPRR